jgi:hypothetical protein
MARANSVPIVATIPRALALITAMMRKTLRHAANAFPSSWPANSKLSWKTPGGKAS